MSEELLFCHMAHGTNYTHGLRLSLSPYNVYVDVIICLLFSIVFVVFKLKY